MLDSLTGLYLLTAAAADAAMDLLAVMMALRMLRVRIRPIRVCFGAFFGSMAAMGIRAARLPAIWTALIWLPLAMIMMRLSGLRRGFRAAVRGAVTLLACFGFLGGTVLALLGATGSLAAAYLLSGGCAAAVFVGALRAARTAADIRCVRVECVIAERRLAFDAVVDSGNSLRDYLTQRPVIVAGNGLAGRLGDAGHSTRLIFADTAGGRQMMHLLIPKETALLLDGRRVSVDAALAFSPGLSKNAPALVPASLLRQER